MKAYGAMQQGPRNFNKPRKIAALGARLKRSVGLPNIGRSAAGTRVTAGAAAIGRMVAGAAGVALRAAAGAVGRLAAGAADVARHAVAGAAGRADTSAGAAAGRAAVDAAGAVGRLVAGAACVAARAAAGAALNLIARAAAGSATAAALAGRFLRDLGQGVISLAYPPRCLGCCDRLFEARTLLCLTCFHGIDRALPSEADARLQRLPQARAVLDEVSCLWIFDKGGALQAVHQALKYGNRPSYGVTLGEPVGAVYLESCTGAAGVDLIVPIPLHRSRLLERGYNQSEMLAKGVAAIVGAPVDLRSLVRHRPTKTQTALKRANRWENLEGAFRVVDPACVRDRHVLIVDDVLTTGSTAGAAAKVLKEAGAARVDLVTMALART